MKKTIVAAMIALPLAAGCSAAAVSYVAPGDPVIGICQQPVISNLASLVTGVDQANNTNPNAGWSGNDSSALDTAQQKDLTQAAQQLTILASQTGNHGDFRQSLLNEATQLQVASVAPGGLTTNTVAVAADTYEHQIQGDCASYQIGTAPKPGPGVWDWGLFWLVVTGYLLMIPVASVLIAFSERERDRANRLSGGPIFGYSVIWWAALLILAGRIYRQFIERMTLTPDEQAEDQRKAIEAVNRRLEEENRKLRALSEGTDELSARRDLHSEGDV